MHSTPEHQPNSRTSFSASHKSSQPAAAAIPTKRFTTINKKNRKIASRISQEETLTSTDRLHRQSNAILKANERARCRSLPRRSKMPMKKETSPTQIHLPSLPFVDPISLLPKRKSAVKSRIPAPTKSSQLHASRRRKQQRPQIGLREEFQTTTNRRTSIPCPIGGSFRLRVGGATVFRSPKQPKQGIGFVDVVPGYDSFRAQLDARQVCTASRSRTPRSSMSTYRTAKMEPHANVAGGSWASSSEEEGPAVQLPWCHHETKRALEGYNHTNRKVVCHHKKEVEREAKTAHDSLEARRQLARIWVGTQDKPVQQPARIYPQEQTQIEVSTAAIEPSSQVNGHSHVGCEAISRLDRLRMKLAKQVRWAKMSTKERQQIYGLAAGNVRQQKASITVASYRTPPPTLRYISAWTPPTVVAPPLPPPPFPEARSEQLVAVFKGHSKVSKHHVQHAAKKVDANVCHDSVSVNTSKAVPNWQRLLGYVPKTLAVKVDFRKVVPRINTGIRRDSTPELISQKSNLERAATKIKRRLDMWSYLEMRKKAGNAKVPLWKMPKA